MLVNPVRTSAALIFDDRGRVLFIREDYGGRRFGPPGGLVEPGETPVATVIREMQEETTLVIAPQHLIGAYFFPDAPSPFLAFAFRCRVVRGSPTVPAIGEIAAVAWVDPSDLPQPLTYLVPHAIQDEMSGLRGQIRTIRVAPCLRH